MSDTYSVYYSFGGEPTRETLAHVLERLEQEYLVGPEAVIDSQSVVELVTDPLESLQVGFDDIAVSLLIESEPDPVDGCPSIIARIQDHVFDVFAEESDKEAIERVDRLYTLLGDIYEGFVVAGVTPLYVPGFAPTETGAAADPDNARYFDRTEVEANELPGIYWFQIVPPAIADAFGRRRFLDAPCFRSEALADGAVLLAVNQGVRTDDPFEYGTESVSTALGVPWERGRP